MQLALVNGNRAEAFSGGQGICPFCKSRVIAKCGTRIKHHWSHYRLKECDAWWEGETDWHRDWKNLFPKECREVIHVADDGEIHRADIKTPTGIYIEIQHSPMTDVERTSREDFYKNLVWVLDGRGFRKNFDIYHMLPDPDSDIAKDLVWRKAGRHLRGANAGLFFRLSDAITENPNVTKPSIRGGRIYSMIEIESEVKSAYHGHHQFDWIKPRSTWLDASCPIYIDFGDNYLVRLENYDTYELRCVRLISKIQFINDVMTVNNINHIAVFKGESFEAIASND